MWTRPYADSRRSGYVKLNSPLDISRPPDARPLSHQLVQFFIDLLLTLRSLNCVNPPCAGLERERARLYMQCTSWIDGFTNSNKQAPTMFLLLDVCASLLYAKLISAEMSLMFIGSEFTGLNTIHWMKAADCVVQAVIAHCDVLINGFINRTADCDWSS